MLKATSLNQIRQYFGGGPLTIDELEYLYVPTAAARGKNPTKRLENLLRSNIENYQKFHILFAGYKGCGKSTELNLLQKHLQDEFLVVNFSVMEELDPENLHYIDLFITTMERLFALIEEGELRHHISESYLESIKNWVQSTEVLAIRAKHLSLEAEAGGGMDIKWFASFFAKFRAAVKSSKSMKETIRKTIEPKLSELLEQCNNLIREVSIHLDKVGKKDLLFIIEDLDKIPLDRADALFYNYANQITDLQANIIFTFPIPLFYNTRYRSIAHYFNQTYVLPMVKINNRDGSVNDEGRAVLRAIVERRMDMGLFADHAPDILGEMISYSGGCLRDLFLMIVEAAENAIEFEKPIMDGADLRSAYLKLKDEYDRTIADKVIKEDGKEQVLIPVGDFYDALVELANSKNKMPEATQVVMELRQNLTILGYNGEGWCDVHPIVRDILTERGKLELIV